MMFNDETLREALVVFGESYIGTLSNELRRLDKKATGRLLKSLESRVIKTGFGTVYTIQLRAEDYLQWVDAGRKPGKYPPLSAIKEWTRAKGISEKLAFPIARSIAKNGIKKTDVIQKSLNKQLRGSQYAHLEDGVSDWVDDMVNQMILNISDNNNITVRI